MVVCERCVLLVCCLNVHLICYRQKERQLEAQIQALKRQNLQQKIKLNEFNARKRSSNKLFNGLSNDQQNKLKYEVTKRKIEKAYIFKETYNGEAGEAALRFRRAIIAFDTRVQNRLGDLYCDDEVLDTICNSMTGAAKEAVSQDRSQMIDDLFEFLQWYDKTFKLTGLRKKLFDSLTNWTVNNSDDNLGIVEKYRNKVRLFELTEPFETDEVLAITYLPSKLMVSSIIKSLQIVKTELHNELEDWIRENKRTPNNLNELEDAIAQGHDTILRLGTVRIKKPKNPVSQPIVNAINNSNTLAEFKSNNELFSSINSHNNSSNSNNSNSYKNTNSQNQSTQYNNYNNHGNGYSNNRGKKVTIIIAVKVIRIVVIVIHVAEDEDLIEVVESIPIIKVLILMVYVNLIMVYHDSCQIIVINVLNLVILYVIVSNYMIICHNCYKRIWIVFVMV